MPGRTFSATSAYRYGFNGKEQDSAVNGNGVDYDYGMRVYDARIGKFLSVDPLGGKFPWYSPYQFAGNTPLQAIDIDGQEPIGYSLASNIQPPGSTWIRNAQDQSVKTIVGDQWFKMQIKDPAGDSWTVYRREKDEYSPELQRMVPRVDHYYLSSNPNDPAAAYSVRNSDGTVMGSLLPFNPQERIDRLTGSGLADETETVFAIGVAAPFAVAAAPGAGSAAWSVWSNPYLQALIGGDIGAAYSYEYGYGGAAQEAEAASSTPSTSPANAKPEPESLDWGRVNHRTGETSSEHVNLHGQNNLQKAQHGIFYGDPVETTDKAWATKGNIQPIRQANGKDIYVIPYANAGHTGGMGGQGENLNYITIITEGGSNKVVTSYPSYNGLPIKH